MNVAKEILDEMIEVNKEYWPELRQQDKRKGFYLIIRYVFRVFYQNVFTNIWQYIKIKSDIFRRMG